MNILAIETGSTTCQVGLQFKGERTFRQLSIRSHSQVILSLIDELLVESGIAKQDLDAIAVNHGPGSFTGIRVGVSAAQGLAFALDIPVYGVSSLQTLALSGYQERSGYREKVSEHPQYLFATIDARMSQIYCAWYKCSSDNNSLSNNNATSNSKIELLGQEQVISPDQLGSIQIPSAKDNLLVLGSGQVYRDQFPQEYRALRSLDRYVTERSNAGSQLAVELDLSDLLDIAERKIAKQGNAFVSKDNLVNTLVEPVYLRNNVTG